MKKHLFSVLISIASLEPVIAGPNLQSPHSIRMETTNIPESAPLNSVNRGFRELERSFDDHTQSQRLSYRIHRLSTQSFTETFESSIRRLLLNIIGGTAPGDTSIAIQSITAGHDLTNRRWQLATFLRLVSSVISPSAQVRASSVVPFNKFESALNAILAREDLKVFTAAILEEGFQTQILILQDEETSELLLLFVTRPPNEI